MAMVITSYTPETGPVTGGTKCTVTGTGLDACVAVLVGDNEATIVGTPTPTTVVFKTPAGAAGNAKVALFDGTNIVEATDPFAYTAVSDGTLVNTLAGKMAVDVSPDGGGSWTRVRGVTTIKPTLAYKTEDDSDTDSGVWESNFIDSIGWSVVLDVKRGRNAGAYDPGQQLLFAAHDQTGDASIVLIRYYDRTATTVDDEAYQGNAMVQWAPQGGNKVSDKVTITLTGQGTRTKIPNPVIADPTLAAPYGS